MRTYSLFVACTAVAFLPPMASASEKTIQPVKVLSTGMLDGEGLDRLIPAGNFFTNQADFEKLWQDWLLERPAPQVDFQKNLVVIATSTEGPIEEASLVSGKKAGQMHVQVKLERKSKTSGFYTLIAVFPRARIESINGQAVPRK